MGQITLAGLRIRRANLRKRKIGENVGVPVERLSVYALEVRLGVEEKISEDHISKSLNRARKLFIAVVLFRQAIKIRHLARIHSAALFLALHRVASQLADGSGRFVGLAECDVEGRDFCAVFAQRVQHFRKVRTRKGPPAKNFLRTLVDIHDDNARVRMLVAFRADAEAEIKRIEFQPVDKGKYGGGAVTDERVGVNKQRERGESQADQKRNAASPPCFQQRAQCAGSSAGFTIRGNCGHDAAIFLWRRAGLFAIKKIQPYAAHFDQIPVIEFGQRPDFDSIDFRHQVSTSEIIPVFVLVDLRRNTRREPAKQPDSGHIRAANHRELSSETILLLVGAPLQNCKRLHPHTIRSNLRALDRLRCMVKHFATLLGIDHHRFIDARSRRFAKLIRGNDCIVRLVDQNMMFADQDGVSIFQHGALDAYVVQERSIEAVQVFNHQRSGFNVNACVIIRDGQIVDGNVIVRRAPDGDRARPERNLFKSRALILQDESRHLGTLLRPKPGLTYPEFRFQIFNRSRTPSDFGRMRRTITLTLSTPPFSLARSTRRSAAFCADMLVSRMLAISGSVTMRDNPSEHSNTESPARSICSSASTSTFSFVPTARVNTLCISLASASCGVRMPMRTFSATTEWSAVSWSSDPALSRYARLSPTCASESFCPSIHAATIVAPMPLWPGLEMAFS